MIHQRRRIQEILEYCYALFSSSSDINVSFTTMSIPTTDTVDNTLSFLSYFDGIVKAWNVCFKMATVWAVAH